TPQELGAGSVKRPHPQIACDLWAGELLKAFAHLPCGFVGERDCKDPVRRNAVCRDQVSNAINNGARLTAASPSEYQKRPFNVCSSCSLWFVEWRMPGSHRSLC